MITLEQSAPIKFLLFLLWLLFKLEFHFLFPHISCFYSRRSSPEAQRCIKRGEGTLASDDVMETSVSVGRDRWLAYIQSGSVMRYEGPPVWQAQTVRGGAGLTAWRVVTKQQKLECCLYRRMSQHTLCKKCLFKLNNTFNLFWTQ